MQGSKVLIVDDDPNIREVISVLLSSEGYDVDAAENGQVAVEKVEAGNEYDIICLDIMMPDMDGIEVCSKIRQKSNVPVLFLTAKSQDKDKVEAYSTGGDDFLVKPFSQTELLMKIKSLIRRHKEYDKVVQNKDLYENVWGEQYLTSAGNTIMVHILNLRKKLERDVSKPEIIKTVWGKGYRVD